MRIVHIFRTPVGGLFRHVRDLAKGQSGLGHKVGIICDSSTGGEQASQLLEKLTPFCELGIHRFPVSRLPGFGDIGAIGKSRSFLNMLKPDIVHGHGAKGGLHGRLAAKLLGVPSVYSPHGGSLHFDWSSPGGAAFLSAEAMQRRIGDGLLFVCDYERRIFETKIGVNGTAHAVVHNGLWPEEFEPVHPEPDAADLLFVGELRKLKGTDVLIDALALVRQKRPVSAVIVGDGEDRAEFEAMAAQKAPGCSIKFCGPLPARSAFTKGHILVMPSRAESFPYIVLEAVAARLPIIATRVGGIPEALPERSLVAANDSRALARAIDEALGSLDLMRQHAKQIAAQANQHFTATAMVQKIDEFYQSLTVR